MSSLYQRANHTAFMMGFDDKNPDKDASYIAHLLTSEIAVLRGPSAVIWEILEEPTSSEDIIAEMTDIYGVPRETVAASVLSFLESLEQQGLITRVEAPAL